MATSATDDTCLGNNKKIDHTNSNINLLSHYTKYTLQIGETRNLPYFTVFSMKRWNLSKKSFVIVYIRVSNKKVFELAYSRIGLHLSPSAAK